MPPKVSVCVPIRNGERHLPATLAALVAQEEQDMEIVALDNASTDATAEILAACTDPRLRVERNDKLLSLPDNWRRVCDLATGDYLKVVCADDVITPDCVSSQVAVLDANPDVSLVASRRDIIDETGQVVHAGRGLRGLLGRHKGAEVARQAALLGLNPIGESAAVMFRTADYHRVGGWDGTLIYPMDLALWLELLAVGDLFGQREALASYRISTTSLTSAFSRRQYEEQHLFMTRMAADERWGLSPVYRHLANATNSLGLWRWSVQHKLLPLRERVQRRRGSA